jgi:hypothetical protein
MHRRRLEVHLRPHSLHSLLERLLLDGLALCDDEVHVSVDGEANDFLVERLRQTAGLEVEAEESLRVASV